MLVYPEDFDIIPIGNVITDTWFAGEAERVCWFDVPGTRISSTDNSGLEHAVSAISSAINSSYDRVSIEYVDVSYYFPPEIRIFGIRLSRFHTETGFIKRLSLLDRSNWQELIAIFHDRKLSKLQSIFICVNCNTEVFDTNRSKISYNMNKYLRFYIITEPEEFLKNEEGLDLSYKLEISTPCWSLLQKDNRLDIVKIYLLNQNLIAVGEPNMSEERWMELLQLGELGKIATKVKSTGKIFIKLEEYEEYECNGLILPETKNIYLQDNQELSSANQPKFVKFIDRLEKELKQTAHKSSLSIWS